jgi:hypothetical protein
MIHEAFLIERHGHHSVFVWTTQSGALKWIAGDEGELAPLLMDLGIDNLKWVRMDREGVQATVFDGNTGKVTTRRVFGNGDSLIMHDNRQQILFDQRRVLRFVEQLEKLKHGVEA